ncbi:MAG: protein kinase [Planctomycetes bacterium]|nr:protein kinase [Planctomycetota bacterium]
MSNDRTRDPDSSHPAKVTDSNNSKTGYPPSHSQPAIDSTQFPVVDDTLKDKLRKTSLEAGTLESTEDLKTAAPIATTLPPESDDAAIAAGPSERPGALAPNATVEYPTVSPDQTLDFSSGKALSGNASEVTSVGISESLRREFAGEAGATVDYSSRQRDGYRDIDFSIQSARQNQIDFGRESEDDSRFPKSIGPYSIVRVLGRGGMGIVYLAYQAKLGRTVALKMVLAGSHSSSTALDRFLSEAKAVAHLQHPNIVQIFEIGEHEQLPFFSLEFVDGQSLDDKLRGKPLPPQEGAKLLVTICRAMQYAHDHGVLHRDLKPANILLSKEGVPKVTDFGLAKRLEEEAAGSGTTREGTVMGTPSYMSPEQAQGAIAKLGPATDQYSLGAMLYEFLTGRPPFVSPKPLETIMQVIKKEPLAPRELQPKVPLDLETICLKTLSKEPEKRYASCAELADDLERYLRGEPIIARPVSQVEKAWRWYKRNRLVGNLSIAAAVGLLAVATISTWSAFTLNSKNKELQTAQEATLEQARIAKQNELTALENERVAQANEKRATESEAVAVRRAESIVQTVQTFFNEVQSIDTNEVPRMKETRDRMMKTILPLIEREVLKEMPTDDKARLTAAALRKTLADDMAAQNMKESAEKYYLELEQFFKERAEKKKTDAARSNYLQIVRSIGDLKRELGRDMESSLAYHQQQLAIAKDIFENSRADENGEGKYPGFQKLQLLARAYHDVAVTYIRIGDLDQAKIHSLEAQRLYQEAITSIETDPSLAQVPAANKQNAIKAMRDALSITMLAYATIANRTGEPEKMEEILRPVVATAKEAFERDQTNASILRDYCGKLGLLSEFLAQTQRTDDGLAGLEEAVKLADRLLTFAPDHTEFIRTAAVAHYRLCQWRRELGLPEADSPGIKALTLRRAKFDRDPRNDRFRIEKMLSEAQSGDVAAAKEIADSYWPAEKLDNELLIELARSYAQMSSRAESDADKTAYRERAIESLKRASAQGYRDKTFVKNELDLKLLRDVQW